MPQAPTELGGNHEGKVVSLETRRALGRTIDGELQSIRCALERSLEEPELFLEAAIAERCPLPGCKVGILDGERGQIGFLVGGERLVGGGDLAEQYGRRPSIRYDVMHGGDESVMR